MSSTVVPFSECFSFNGIFKKYVSVKVLENSLKEKHYYVDIRLNVIFDDGVERPTKNGVFLTLEEFKAVLPKMMSGRYFEITGRRKVIWRKDKENPGLFIIRLEKEDLETKELKIQELKMTSNDVKELINMKDRVFRNIKKLKCNQSVGTQTE